MGICAGKRLRGFWYSTRVGSGDLRGKHERGESTISIGLALYYSCPYIFAPARLKFTNKPYTWGFGTALGELDAEAGYPFALLGISNFPVAGRCRTCRLIDNTAV